MKISRYDQLMLSYLDKISDNTYFCGVERTKHNYKELVNERIEKVCHWLRANDTRITIIGEWKVRKGKIGKELVLSIPEISPRNLNEILREYLENKKTG